MSIKISELGNLTSFTDETLVAVVNTAATYTTVKANGAVLKTYVLGSLGTNITLANTIQSQQIAAANIGIIGYINLGNTIQSAQIGAANLAIIAANVGMLGYVNNVNNQANLALKGYVDSQVTAANVAWTANAYQQEQDIANIRILIDTLAPPYYSNANVTSYLPTHTGNVGGKITTAAQQYITSLGVLTTLAVAGNTTITGNLSAGSLTIPGAAHTLTGNVTITGNAFSATPTAGANSTQIATTAYVQRPGWNSQGRKTISTSPPAGGSDGDIWYQV
jgi:hypothetical protein